MKLTSPAKLNLSLLVYPPRVDGYHPIQSVFQAISLCDEIDISAEGGSGFELSCSNPDIPVDGQNILSKIYADFADKIPVKLTVHLDKHIPVGAGLGGGSSNGAVFLNYLNTEFNLGYSVEALSEVSLKYGADLPFFVVALNGSSTAYVSGIGEHIAAIPKPRYPYYVLMYPNFFADTAKVYHAFDTIPFEYIRPYAPDAFVEGFMGLNLLTKAAFKLYPVLIEIQHWALSSGMPFTMSGSGSTVFWSFATEEESQACYERVVKEFPQYSCFKAGVI